MNENQEELLIFISHRHKDKKIADVFRAAIVDWTSGRVKVTQSSAAGTALVIGDKLEDSIRKAIAGSNIVLLIYTGADADWSWCMYECGLSLDPNSEDTRIVIFQCTEDVPDPLRERVAMKMSDEESIKQFVIDFHSKKGFFPRYDKALFPDISSSPDLIEQRSQELLMKLREEISDIPPKVIPRWGHLTLALNLEQLKDVKNAKDFDDAFEHAKQLIAEECVVKSHSGNALENFNTTGADKDIKFSELIGRWNEKSRYPHLDWRSELYKEMTRVMRDNLSEPVSIPFDSIKPESGAWYLPIVNRVRVLPVEGTMEFDVFLYGVRPDIAMLMIGEGPQEADREGDGSQETYPEGADSQDADQE